MKTMRGLLRNTLVLPLVVLVIGGGVSVALSMVARQDIAESARQRFDAIALNVARKVESRFDDYTSVLIGLRARFNTAEPVTRSEFRDYVAGLSLASNYPGFQLVNFAPYVEGADKARFEERVRADTSTDATVVAQFAIHPPGQRADYYPLTLVEPLVGNEKLLGRDLGAMPNRGNALEQSRDTGGLFSSGRKIDIKGREADIALAMRLPVYRRLMPLDTVEQRRAAYVGSVGAGFRVADMLRDVASGHVSDGLRLRLIDAGSSRNGASGRVESSFTQPSTVAGRQVLFDNVKTADPASVSASGSAVRDPAVRLERTLVFELGGHAWLVEVGQDRDRLVGALDEAVPWLLLLGGLAISTLLAGIVHTLTTSRARARKIAEAMTIDLRASERRLEEAQHLASIGSWVLDADTGALRCSEEARRLLGFDTSTDGLDLHALLLRIPVDERDAVEQKIAEACLSGERAEFEHRLCLLDGTERWVHVIVQVTEEGGRAVMRGVVRDDTQHRMAAQRLKLEHEIARLLVGDGDKAALVSQSLQAVCTHLRWDFGALWSVHEDGQVRCDVAWHADADIGLAQFTRISRSLEYRPDEGSLGRAWALGDAVRVDASALGQSFTREALAGQSGLSVGLVVPMPAAGSTMALEFFSRNRHAADADALESLRVIALQLAQYEQRKQAEQRLRFVASHDGLTGLSNRAALQHDLIKAIKRGRRHQKRFAVMFIDLDRFKQINDSLGHSAGDAMLKACGERLSAALRSDDVVARFGGDEFVLVLENLSSASDAARLAEKALACCAEPFVVDGRELHVTASIGVSVYPEDGSDAETLLKNADTAMYRAKDKGRGTYQFYAAQMNARSTERLTLENGLRHALERGELELHYQPKMNLRSRRIVGVEALMRWRHPQLGSVSPGQFIPIAEETGIIESLGKWALKQACQDARLWQECGLPPVQMSVNLSPRQLSSRSLIADIGAILKTSGLEPSLLELEITEGAMMKSPEVAAALLQQIRDLGVSLAIDDFGTGYSSLSYLKRFPLSTVKIDRSFVNDLVQDADARSLTDGIIALSHGLRMKVVAEGVETAAQLAYLQERGCDEIQGYWLCKPLPADDVRDFMAQHMRNLFASPVAA